jgi:hypothetical protein
MGTKKEEFEEKREVYIHRYMQELMPRTYLQWIEFDRTPEGKEHRKRREELIEEFYAKVMERIGDI